MKLYKDETGNEVVRRDEERRRNKPTERDREVYATVSRVRRILKKEGLDLMERVKVKDIKTGKIYR